MEKHPFNRQKPRADRHRLIGHAHCYLPRAWRPKNKATKATIRSTNDVAHTKMATMHPDDDGGTRNIKDLGCDLDLDLRRGDRSCDLAARAEL